MAKQSGGLRRFTGELVLGLAAEAQLRWAAVELGGVAEEARLRHDLSPVAASALGRALAGAVLLQRLSARSCRRVVLSDLRQPHLEGSFVVAKRLPEMQSPK